MIKKFSDSPLEKFQNVNCRKLAEGKKIAGMVTYFKKGDKLPVHRHSNEQVGYVVEGKLKIFSSHGDFVVEKGDSYAFSENMEHGFEALEDSETVDMFKRKT